MSTSETDPRRADGGAAEAETGTEAGHGIRTYLGAIAEGYYHLDVNPAREDLKYRTYEELVLAEGRLWTPEQVRHEKLGPVRECYSNAIHAAVTNDWGYVEGFAASVFPVMHAWCVDEDGMAVEVTWDQPGTEYMGIVMNPTDALARMIRNKVYGVMPNDWMNKMEMLR